MHGLYWKDSFWSYMDWEYNKVFNKGLLAACKKAPNSLFTGTSKHTQKFCRIGACDVSVVALKTLKLIVGDIR